MVPRSTASASWLWLLLAAAATGCSTYTGSAQTLHPLSLTHERGWLAIESVPLRRQTEEHDCGPTALAMVFAYHHRAADDPALAALPRDRQISVGELRDLARDQGFSAFVVAGTPEDLVYELKHQRPAIVGVAKPTVNGAVTHYEVVVGMNRDSQRIATLDPAAGWRQNSFAGFLSEWQATGRVLLVLVPAAPAPPPTAAIVSSNEPARREP